MEAFLVIALVLAVIAFVIAAIVKYRAHQEAKELQEVNEVEMVEEQIKSVNRPLADFRPVSEETIELRARVERLENAIILVEQAFKWKLIPELDEEPLVSVLEQVEAGHISYVPAILLEEEQPLAKRPILPRLVK